MSWDFTGESFLSFYKNEILIKTYLTQGNKFSVTATGYKKEEFSVDVHSIQDFSSILYIEPSNPSLAYLGYDSTYIPIFNYSFLRRTALEFINNAVQLERDLLSYRSSEDNADLRRLQMENAMNVAKKTVEVGDTRIALSDKAIDLANANRNQAQSRADNKAEQVARFTEYHPIAVGRAKITEARVRAEKSDNKYVAAAGRAAKYAESFMNGTLEALEYSGVSFNAGVNLGVVSFGSSYNPGAHAQMNHAAETFMNLEREATELNGMVEVADYDIKKEEEAKKVVIAERAKDITQYNGLLKEYAALQTGTLSKSFWSGMSERAGKLYQRYLRYGTTLAWLAQRAYESENIDNIDYIRYGYIPNDTLLSAQQLLFDLNNIEYRRVTTKKLKEIPTSYVFSLNLKNTLNMQRLRETGKIQFDISQFELDNQFPGLYRSTIDNIDIQVVALSDPSGIKVNFSKEGMSWMKVPTTYQTGKTKPVWDTLIPSNYVMLGQQEDPETMILPKQQNPIAKTDNEGVKRLFEGRGVCGNYTLELPFRSNKQLNFNTIVDVIVKIDFSSYYDPDLKNAIEEELCMLQEMDKLPLGNTASYTFANNSSEDFYLFQNNTDKTKKYKLIPIWVKKEDMSPNQFNEKIESIFVNFVGKKGSMPFNCRFTSTKMNPTKKFTYEEGDLIFENPNDKIDYLHWFPDASRGEKFDYLYDNLKKETLPVRTSMLSANDVDLFDLWILRIDASQEDTIFSTNGEFDENKIKTLNDVLVNFSYSYKGKICNKDPNFIVDENLIKQEPNSNTPFILSNEYHKKKFIESKNIDWQVDNIDGSFKVSNLVNNNQLGEILLNSNIGLKEWNYDLEVELIFDENTKYASILVPYLLAKSPPPQPGTYGTSSEFHYFHGFAIQQVKDKITGNNYLGYHYINNNPVAVNGGIKLIDNKINIKITNRLSIDKKYVYSIISANGVNYLDRGYKLEIEGGKLISFEYPSIQTNGKLKIKTLKIW